MRYFSSKIFSGLLGLLLTIGGSAIVANAQTETYTGTIISFGTGTSTRTVTRNFTLNINSKTSDTESDRLIGILQDKGQTDLVESMRDLDLGTFILSGRLGDKLNVVRTKTVDGKERIIAAFVRRTELPEIRWGYRSLDYPFTVIELLIDPATGKGEGTFIGAARVKWNKNADSRDETIEIEGFATFPGKIVNIKRSVK
ncbi:MAG: hypothetical protein KF685_08195 [Acidobacteria bacterium]|nr:hypothetical protein [Acidobacteriota bacterium]